MKKNKCKKCLYEWVARTDNPKVCPRCKSWNWKEEKENEN